MIITKLEAVGKHKIHVYIDDVFAFWLYKKDIALFSLKECEPISKETYDDIIDNTVFYRAKLKALDLLQHMDRTEKELRSRLARESYSSDIIERTMDYVKSFHYIDDLRYTISYIRSKQMTKSRKQISAGLYSKGIFEDTIAQAYEALNEMDGESENPEILAIKRIVSKKCNNISELTKEEKLKLSASLYRKGFSTDNIRKVFSMSEFD